MKIKYLGSGTGDSAFGKINGVTVTTQESDADWVVIEIIEETSLTELPRGDEKLVFWWRKKSLPPENFSAGRFLLFASDEKQVYYILNEKSKGGMKPAPQLNPLTGLPGNREILNSIREACDSDEKALLYLDLTDFKPYNEAYGFTSGDRVLVSFARLLQDLLDKVCRRGDYFLGHIGGDDFFASIKIDKVDDLFNKIDSGFLTIRESFYNPADKSRGSIIAFNRKGEREEFPLMGVCGVAFSPRRENTFSPDRASAFATYLKETAKSRRNEGNVFITPDRIDFIPGGLVDFSLDDNISIDRRRAVIEAMGQRGMAHYGRALTEIYEKSSHIMLKKSILYSLGQLRYLPALDLIKAALNDKNPHIRTRAVEALGYIGGGEEVERIGDMVNDPNPYTAVMATRALGVIGHPAGLKYLKNLPPGASRWLKLQAAHSRCILKDNEAIKILNKIIYDYNSIYRKKAALTFSFIKTAESLNMLIRAFFKEKAAPVRKAQIISSLRIAESLSRETLPEFSKELWKMYRKAPPDLKPFFLSLGSRMAGSGFIKEAEKNMDSKSANVRRQVAAAFSFSEKRKHKNYLLSRLQDISPIVREETAFIMGERGDLDCLEMLRKSLKDKDSRVRKRAARAIIKLIEEGCEKK